MRPPPQGTGLSAPGVPAAVSSVASLCEPPQDQQQSGQIHTISSNKPYKVSIS